LFDELQNNGQPAGRQPNLREVSMKPADLDALETLLREGLRLSGQGSFRRRAPAPAALPPLTKARAGLRRHVKSHPDDVRALRLLALAEEALLAYPLARAALERAVALGGGDRRDLKRLAMLRLAETEDEEDDDAD
jgi:hypothetical protein